MKIFPVRFGKAYRKAQSISKLYMRLKSRITMYFFLLVMIPSLLTVAILYSHTRSLAEEMSYNAAVSRITQEKELIGNYLDELKLTIHMAASAIGTEDAEHLTSTSAGAESSDILSAMIKDNFSPAQQNALSAVYVINEGGIIASYGPDSAHAVISSPSSQKWFMDASADTGNIVMLGTTQRFYSEGVNKMVLSAAKSLNAGIDTAPPSVLLFDFNYSLLSDFLIVSDGYGPDSNGGHKAAERLILDREGNILYSRDRGKLTTKADEAIISAMRAGDKSFVPVNYKGSDYFMTYTDYAAQEWIFIDLNPASNVSERLWLRSPMLTVVLVLFGLVLLIYLGVTLGLLKPINELTAVISDYENQYPGAEGQIPLLQVRKNDSAAGSTSEVDYLINKISSIKLSQKEAELNSLQNQINPHFLYNTLESIRGAALYHGIHEIASMSKSLSLLFRYSISERVLVSVKEELQHLENYISIQNFRFEDKFELEYNIPPELMNYKILKLTLQPLIENSIKHGLEMKLGKGTIKIEILSLESNIKLIISDDGLGIPPKKLEELNRSLTNDKSRSTDEGVRTGTGIGVMNVNSRIRLYFGEQYGLRFRDALAGTTVEITLPAVKES
ncbi:MAG: histidine kinase [Clostridiaceae bacterium]|jgi:two-component system sensor histidine kinase YesM|nr:histidine kinase [Clostridiaceae bacterium]